MQLADEKTEFLRSMTEKLAELEAKYSSETQYKDYFSDEVRRLQNELIATESRFENQAREREQYIHDVENAYQQQKNNLEEETQKLSKRVTESEQEVFSSMQTTENLSLELEKVNRMYTNLQNEYESLGKMNDALKNEIYLCQNEMKELRGINFEGGLRMKKIEDERKNIEDEVVKCEKEKNQILDKFNNYGEQLQKVYFFQSSYNTF
jgi:chromosome segregation ATPase